MPDSGPVIRPLREDEYDAFVVRAKAFYVSDMVAAGIDPVVANAKSEHDFPQLLSEGLATPSHLIYAIEDRASPRGTSGLPIATASSGTASSSTRSRWTRRAAAAGSDGRR